MLINKINALLHAYFLYGPHKLNRSIHNKVEGEHNKKKQQHLLTFIFL